MLKIGRAILLLSLPVFFQLTLKDLAYAQASAGQYAEEAVVIEEFRITEEYDDQGRLEYQAVSRVRVQSEAGVRQFGTLITAYDRELGSMDYVYVRVTKPDGTSIETPVSTALDIPSEITRSAPQYTSTYEKHLNVRGLSAGDTLEYEIRMQQKSAIPGHFWAEHDFLDGAIVRNQEFRISFPASRQVIVKSTNTQPTVSEDNGHKTYVWKAANLKRLDEKRRLARAREREEKGPDIQVTSFRSWEELGRAARDLFHLQTAVTPAIRAKVEEITKGAATEAEKTQAIYAYVATKFRYVGVSFGTGRIQPHPASEVLSNGFGDCKDKHVLLSAMLQAAGIPSHPALIHVDRKLDPEVPSPMQFNHVVTAVPQQQGYTWLDTTLEVAPFGFLIDRERDKQVLLVPNEQAASLVKTPAQPVRPNRETFKAEGKLDANGIFLGLMKQTMSGDAEVIFRALYRNVPKTAWLELTQNIVQRLGFGGKVSELEVSDPEDTGSEFRIQYSYRRENYSNWEDKQIGAPLPPVGLPVVEADKDMDEPIRLGSPGLEILYEATVQLPAEYEAAVPGEKKQRHAQIDSSFARYEANFDVEGQMLRASRRLRIKEREIPITAVADFREFRKAVDDLPYFVVLSKPVMVSEQSKTSAQRAEADRLIAQGQQALQRREMALAQELFRRATEAEPEHPDAWRYLGGTYVFMNRDMDQGLALMRKQVEIAPSRDNYVSLGSILTLAGRSQEALKVWQDFVAALPDNADAPAFLGSALLKLGRHKEALAYLATAVERNPTADKLYWNLGEAHLAVGDIEGGRTALKRMLEIRSDADTWNRYAYTLAEFNVDPDEALTYAQKAVAAGEARAATLNLSASQMDVRSAMNALVARWDTLGWIYFRKGDLEQAQKYLSAAWEISQASVSAEHLAALFLARKDVPSATKFYARAAAAPSARSSEGFKKLVPSAARRASLTSEARDELSRIRTTRIRRSGGPKGAAEFDVVMAAGDKIEAATLVSGDQQMNAMVDQLLKTPIKSTIPSSTAKLVRRGMLMCSEATVCDFVLVPPPGPLPTTADPAQR